MKLSSSAEYATRLMVALARSHGSAPLSSERLAESENVPADYVNQILLRLKRAGLVASHRGTAGGYALAREPKAVTLGQVIRAVDGAIFEDVCAKFEAGERDCRHQGACAISPVWKGLGAAIERYLDGVTLDALLAKTEAASGVSLAWAVK